MDGATEPVYGQVLGGWGFVARGELGNAFAGFVVLAGLSFAGGNLIVHDPTVLVDVPADLQLPIEIPADAARALLVATVVVVVLALVLLGVVWFLTRRKKTPPMT